MASTEPFKSSLISAFDGCSAATDGEVWRLDHYRYTLEDLEDLYDAAERERADCLVTTEKDAVRISDPGGSPLPVYYLRGEIEIIRGAADFDEAVGRICFPQNALAARVDPGVIGGSP